jgi:hypothetical protein
MATTINTIQQIYGVFKSIADRHKFIDTFVWGNDSNIGASAEVVYPLLAVKPTAASMLKSEEQDRYAIFEVQLEVKVVDQIIKDNEVNIDVESDSLQTLREIIIEFNNHPFYQEGFMLLVDDIDFEPLDEFNDDLASGWQCVVNLKMRNPQSLCSLPIENLTGYYFAGGESGAASSSPYLTCATITACTSFQDFVEAATSGFISNTDFTGHTSNTSNPHQVTASQVGAYSTEQVNNILTGYTTSTDFTGHTSNTSNPHNTTAAQVGAYSTGQVDNLLNTKSNISGATFSGAIDAPIILSGGTNLYSIFSNNQGQTVGIHNQIMYAGSSAPYSHSIGAVAPTTVGHSANRFVVFPYVPCVTHTTTSLGLEVTTTGATNARILVYSDSNFRPLSKLLETTNLDCSTLGVKTFSTGFTFQKNVVYWLSVHSSGNVTYRGFAVANCLPIGVQQVLQYNMYITPITYGSAPATCDGAIWGNIGSQTAPMIRISI